jgi:DNA polymerase-3 subunit epsilon
MDDRCISFDAETPNCVNSRMSAIGITVIDQGTIVGEF